MSREIIVEKRISSKKEEEFFLRKMANAGYKWLDGKEPTNWHPSYSFPYYIHVWNDYKHITWSSSKLHGIEKSI